jgi:hypothetical protein
MAMAMEPVYSLKDFQNFLENPGAHRAYPYYCALLYAPMNGLNGRLHRYVVDHWTFLNTMTGSSCLLMAAEDIGGGLTIEQFKPQEIYDIARHLGAAVSDVPCMIFFTNPASYRDTLVLKLGQLLAHDVSDEDLTDFFQSLSSITDACGEKSVSATLDCLKRGIATSWPDESAWSAQASRTASWVVASVGTGATLATSFETIFRVVRPLLGL